MSIVTKIGTEEELIPSPYRNDGYFYYHAAYGLNSITQAVAFNFDKLEYLGLSAEEAFAAFWPVVFGKSIIDAAEIVRLKDSITVLEPELLNYDMLRWWQEGAEILMIYNLRGITDNDIDFGELLLDINSGPDTMSLEN